MSDVEVGEHENGNKLELHRQQTLRITLAEAPTAGFRWTLRASDQHALLLLADHLDPAMGAVGGTAMHHWEFRAEETGKAEINFDYARPWERATAAARSFSVSVRVL